MPRPFAGIVAAMLLATATGAAAQFYSCTDARGNRYTSDRPIPQCADREQKLLNRDGSQRGSVGPSLSAEERAANEEAQRRRQAEEVAQKDVVRHDRNLMARYPNQTAHARARESVMEPARQALRAAEKRLADLANDRTKLDAESEFYVGKPLPRGLKQHYDQNQAAVQAQEHAIDQHRAELARLQSMYDDELARLKKLWAGARPGTVGPIPTAIQPTAAVSPGASSTTR